MSTNMPDIHVKPEFFERFFALIPELAVIASADGHFRRVNPSWKETLGYTDEQLQGMSLDRLVHPEDLESTLAEWSRRIAGTTATSFVNRCLCGDGSYRSIEWKAAPAADESLVFATGRDITERTQVQMKLEDQDRQLSTIYGSVSDALFLLSVEGDDRYRFLTVNRTFLRLTGLTEPQVKGKYLEEVIPAPSLPTVLESYRQAIRTRSNIRWEEVSDYPAGIKCGEVSITAIFDEKSRCTNIVGTVRDLTEQRQARLDKARLEDELRQAQKMESLGRLAGGVAHDFNNLLTVINGCGELLHRELRHDDRLRQHAALIESAGERAANLTRQLLAFSRRQVIQPKPLELNAVIRETQSMLQRLIGEDISLVIRLDAHASRVLADPDRIHQVLLNVVANARDAMPHGGTLIIETSEAAVDTNYLRTHAGAREGRCVVMTFKDTGFGMDEATRQKIFEPFFTTKEPGKGTGLGLASVYGIVHQLNGWIEVESEPGIGTTFRIFLPRTEKEDGVQPDAALTTTVQPGSETILLVEDQENVRGFVRTALTSDGYEVLDAANGAEAIDLSGRYAGDIHIMITDVLMPGMNGVELAARLKPRRPDMKVLFMSGHTADVIVHHGTSDAGAGFLLKPFSRAALAAKVREVLTALAPHSD